MPSPAPYRAPPPVGHGRVQLEWVLQRIADRRFVGGCRRDYVLAPTVRHDADLSNAVYGSYFGYQYQWGRWVVGAEAGYNTVFTGHDWGHSLSGTADCLSAGPVGRTCQDRVKNYWTAGGKLGYAVGNWMVYGTGGYADGRVQTRPITSATGAILDYTSERHGGWFAGAGIDLYVTRLWWSDLIIGLQYQHVDLGTERHFDTTTVGLNALHARHVRDRRLRRGSGDLQVLSSQVLSAAFDRCSERERHKARACPGLDRLCGASLRGRYVTTLPETRRRRSGCSAR